MASSQNEQDNRRYAVAAGVPMFEPADSQEAYDFTLRRLGTFGPLASAGDAADDHAGLPLEDAGAAASPPASPAVRPRDFDRDIRGRVMIPAHARPAHRRLAAKAGGNRRLERDLPVESNDRRRPQPGHHHLRRHVHARPRGRAQGRRAETGLDLSAAAGADSPVRRERRSLHRRRGRRSVPVRADSRGGHRGRAEAGDVPLRRVGRGPGAADPRRRHLARADPSAGQAAGAVRQLPPPRHVRVAQEARLHRRRRHRLLHARRAAAV